MCIRDSTNTKETTTYYSESEDDVNQNRAIITTQANAGVWHSGLVESFNGRTDKLSQNELLKKTNDNFTAGKYRTLVARFHTNSDDSKDESNPVPVSYTHLDVYKRQLLWYGCVQQVTVQNFLLLYPTLILVKELRLLLI